MATSKEQEIEALRAEQYETRRACAPALEEILYQPIPVLDHGFVRVIDYMGDDAAIVQAARVSYGRGTKKKSDDIGLIRYLMRHRHTTPFEMCEIKLHVKLPIFVARQWIRHRTANVNEYSARYSILDREFYVPDKEHLRALKAEEKYRKAPGQKPLTLFEEVQLSATGKQSEHNKQGRDDFLDRGEAREVIERIQKDSTSAYTAYMYLLNDESHPKFSPDRKGLTRELARMILPVNYYTQWYWKIDLYNLMHFLSLRADSHAQYEIRIYAEEILKIMQRWVPATYQAFCDYRFGGENLSAQGLAIVKRLIAGEKVTQDNSGLSKREWRELKAALGQED